MVRVMERYEMTFTMIVRIFQIHQHWTLHRRISCCWTIATYASRIKPKCTTLVVDTTIAIRYTLLKTISDYLFPQDTKNLTHIQKERESRSRNFIIHGLHEPQNAESRGDRNTINEFLKVVQVEASVDSVIRLGKHDETKARTIRVVLKTANEKNSVMKNLSKLKNAPDIFTKISVTDDYTAEER